MTEELELIDLQQLKFRTITLEPGDILMVKVDGLEHLSAELRNLVLTRLQRALEAFQRQHEVKFPIMVWGDPLLEITVIKQRDCNDRR